MSRQLNLRVSDEFVERLDRLSRRLGRPMAAVLEAVGTPALEMAEADAKFEAEALAAWEECELTGKFVTSEKIDALFADSLTRAKAAERKKP